MNVPMVLMHLEKPLQAGFNNGTTTFHIASSAYLSM